MRLTAESLDDRWLEFVNLTTPLVRTHPYFWPVRQLFYKLQFEHHQQINFTKRLKELIRIGLHRAVSTIPDKNIDVLFWLHSSREPEVEAIIPLWQRVRALQLKAIIVAPPAVIDALRLSASDVVPFSAPHRRGDPKKWKRTHREIISLFPEISSNGAKNLLCYLGRQADSYESEIERVLTCMRPKLLVLPVDQFMPGASACLIARRLGIQSLVLLHGAVSAYNVPITADCMAVWGDVSHQQMEKLGVASERLKIFGSPRHDSLPYKHDSTAKSRLAQAVGCDLKLCLTFFSNGNDLYRNTKKAVMGCAQWLMAAADKLGSKMNFLVKLHPNEDGALYAECKRLRLFKNECDLGTALAGSDITAALCSTTLAEALLYEKPVLQFYAEGWPELADNWRRGLALRIDSSDDLVNKLAMLQCGEQRLGLISEQKRFTTKVFANRGHATEVIANFIIEECARCAY